MRSNIVNIETAEKAAQSFAPVGTNDPMSMMLSRTLNYIAIIFLCLATAVGAQENGRNDNGDPLDQVVPVTDEGADDLDPLDQVVRVADEDADDRSPLDQVVPVADEGLDNAILATATGVEAEELLAREFARYKELASDGVLDEAQNVAKRIVELQIRISGPLSTDTANALTNLAIIQHRSGQYVAAQQNFQTAVDIIEDNEDRLNAALVNPLTGLGASQLEGGRPDLAARTYVRAVHITHVNEGPHNMDQVRLLEALAESNLRLGSPDEAKDIHDTIHALNLRHFASDQMGIIPAMMRRAAWQHRAGYIIDERATYRRAIRIIETTTSKKDLALIDPLTQLGKSFFYVDLTGAQGQNMSLATSGEIYYKRALRIAETNPESNWEIESGAKLALGDYYMHRSHHSRARKIYREAWDTLSEDEARLEKRRESLEQVVLLKRSDLPLYAGTATRDDGLEFDESVQQGTIIVSFSVTNRGRVSDLKIIEANPVDFTDMQRFVRRELRTRLYRPRLEDGDTVATTDLAFTHTYFYWQSDLDALRTSATDDE